VTNPDVIEIEPQTNEVEDPAFELTVRVYTVADKDFRVKFGLVNMAQFQTVIDTLTSGYQSLRQNSSITLVDRDGLAYIFNMDRVTCVQVERRDLG
jgi:hypothetical protein